MEIEVTAITCNGYAILPWDFLPDLIPFIGWIDDIAILIVATLIFLGLGSSSTAFSSAQNPDGKNKEKPKGQVFDGEYRVIDDDDKA